MFINAELQTNPATFAVMAQASFSTAARSHLLPAPEPGSTSILHGVSLFHFEPRTIAGSFFPGTLKTSMCAPRMFPTSEGPETNSRRWHASGLGL